MRPSDHTALRTRPKMRGMHVATLLLLLCLPILAYGQQPPPPGLGGPAGPPPGGPKVTIPTDVKVLRDIVYVKGGGAAQSLDLYLPQKTKTSLPLVIGIHGGGFMFGSKEMNDAIALLDAGFAVASINYRLSAQAHFPAQIEDCKAAVRFLRAHATEYGFDGTRIGVWGASAGGFLAAMLGTAGDATPFDVGENLNVSSRVQAVCDWFGPTDLATLDGPFDPADRCPPEQRQKHFGPDSPEAALLGRPIEADLAKSRAISPVAFVTKAAPPFLIMHGDQDGNIPLGQSRELYTALTAAKVDARLVILVDSGHGSGIFQQPEAVAMVRQFFLTHLAKR